MIERAILANPNYARAYNFRGLLRAWNGGVKPERDQDFLNEKSGQRGRVYSHANILKTGDRSYCIS